MRAAGASLEWGEASQIYIKPEYKTKMQCEAETGV